MGMVGAVLLRAKPAGLRGVGMVRDMVYVTCGDVLTLLIGPIHTHGRNGSSPPLQSDLLEIIYEM